MHRATKYKQAIEAGRILVNNKIVQPNYKIRPSIISLLFRKAVHGEEIIPEKIPLNIVYGMIDCTYYQQTGWTRRASSFGQLYRDH